MPGAAPRANILVPDVTARRAVALVRHVQRAHRQHGPGLAPRAGAAHLWFKHGHSSSSSSSSSSSFLPAFFCSTMTASVPIVHTTFALGAGVEHDQDRARRRQPLPLAPDSTRIHGTSGAAVHAHSLDVRTSSRTGPPRKPVLTRRGRTVKSHAAAAAACVTVSVRPAIAHRAGPRRARVGDDRHLRGAVAALAHGDPGRLARRRPRAAGRARDRDVERPAGRTDVPLVGRDGVGARSARLRHGERPPGDGQRAGARAGARMASPGSRRCHCRCRPHPRQSGILRTPRSTAVQAQPAPTVTAVAPGPPAAAISTRSGDRLAVQFWADCAIVTGLIPRP